MSENLKKCDSECEYYYCNHCEEDFSLDCEECMKDNPVIKCPNCLKSNWEYHRDPFFNAEISMMKNLKKKDGAK